MLATLLLVFAFLVIGGIKIQATAVASHKIETIWAEEPKCVRLCGEQGVEWGGWEQYHRHFAQVPTTRANKKENNEVGCIASVTTWLRQEEEEERRGRAAQSAPKASYS